MYLERTEHNLYWKMKFLKQATFIRYVLAKLSNFVQISTQTFSDSVLQGFFWKLNWDLNYFPDHICPKKFDKRSSFVMLHKLAEFHHQTVFTSQVIH